MTREISLRLPGETPEIGGYLVIAKAAPAGSGDCISCPVAKPLIRKKNEIAEALFALAALQPSARDTYKSMTGVSTSDTVTSLVVSHVYREQFEEIDELATIWEGYESQLRELTGGCIGAIVESATSVVFCGQE